ncbi:MAG: type II secretion system protein GspC [Desulfobacterales bacterium S5133MH16]|nr:MAG: type II secretion system protein GspC [Desulfobacterales bacterium S5133MH16]
MKRYFAALNILLIAVAVYFSVKAFYKVATADLNNAPSREVTTRHVISSEDVTVHPMPYYRTIVERNLFNSKKGAEQHTERVDIETLEPTDLKLKLLGTVSGNNKKAYAVIEDTAKKHQDLYRIGDSIQNATLKMILREKVILRVNGKDEILNIEEASGSRKTGIVSKRAGMATSQNITLKRSRIESAVKDVNNLMKQVRIRPHFRNGKPDGLRLTGIRPNSIFYNMGLKSGDIITGVNNNNIESVDDVLKFYQSLQSSSSVQLQIKRRGRPKTINYNIE